MEKYSDSWYKNLNKSPYTPPSWVFGIVWPILYTTLFISFISFNMQISGKFLRILGVSSFIIQLVFNFLWPIVFFREHNIKDSLSCLMVILFFTSIYLIICVFNAKLTFFITLPYFLWCLYAFYLNLYIVKHN